MNAVAIVLAIIVWKPTQAIIGYDCGGSGMNLTTLSLLDIGSCDLMDVEPKEEDVHVQLIQLADYDHTQVMQCKIEVDRTIYHCGMHSHISAVHNGRREYLVALSALACTQLHTTGMIDLGGNAQIVGLKPNSTDYRSVTLAGSLGVDGTCYGTQYSDPYGTWNDVVVQASIKISLRSYRAPVKLSTNRVILDSGLHCLVSDGHCLDNQNGETFWSPIPLDSSCQFNRYDVLYDGIAKKLTPEERHSAPEVYTVNTQETTFALTKAAEMNLCGYTLIRTEHPKLFILETKKGQTFRTRTRLAVDNLDIFSYVNSKFVYVEKHLRKQMTQLYRDVITQKCALERQVLKNALALSSVAPEEMAFAIMKSPGYLAVAAGEVLHVIKCIPVECKIRPTTDCYKELPVTHRNTSMFLQPKSRILTRVGTARDCNEFVPVMYNVAGVWYKILPKPVESTAPQIIQPLTKPAWKYTSPEALASSGIYSAQDLERLRDHIMFPMEQPSMLATLAKGAMGRDVPRGSIRIMNLLDEETMDHIAKTTGERLWNGFITFGSVSAGVMAIFLIFKAAKFLVDVLIRGYALHTIYGWSVHLLGAVWGSVTSLIIHLAGNASARDTATMAEGPTADQPSSAARRVNNDLDLGSDGGPTAPEPAVRRATRGYPTLDEYLQQVREQQEIRI